MKEQLVLRRGTPVRIDWEDSASYGGWQADSHDMKSGKVSSIGYVFGISKEGIILTTSLARVPTNPDVVALDSLVVPHGCIRDLQVLDLAVTKPMPLQLEGVLAGADDGHCLSCNDVLNNADGPRCNGKFCFKDGEGADDPQLDL